MNRSVFDLTSPVMRPRTLNIENIDMEIIDSRSSRNASKQIPAHSPTLKPNNVPSSIQEIDSTMSEMDRLHRTHFTAWIQSERNISYFCTFKRRLLMEYYNADRMQTLTVLQWISKDWSTASVAELVIKLFYNIRLSSFEFGNVVAHLTLNWHRDEILELVSVLLIGETAESCVLFICHFTGLTSDSNCVGFDERNGWEFNDILGLIENCSSVMQWKESFMETFLVELATFLIDDPVCQRAMINTLYNEFHQRSLSMKFKDLSTRSVFGEMEDDEESILESIGSLNEDYQSAHNAAVVNSSTNTLEESPDTLTPPSTPQLSRKTYQNRLDQLDRMIQEDLDRTDKRLNGENGKDYLDLFLAAVELIFEQAFDTNSSIKL